MGVTNWSRVFPGGLLARVVMLVLGFALMNSACSKAKNDSFTGTWRDSGVFGKIGQLVIAPSGDGLSFQRSMYEEPLVIRYGKEFVYEYPFL